MAAFFIRVCVYASWNMTCKSDVWSITFNQIIINELTMVRVIPN